MSRSVGMLEPSPPLWTQGLVEDGEGWKEDCENKDMATRRVQHRLLYPQVHFYQTLSAWGTDIKRFPDFYPAVDFRSIRMSLGSRASEWILSIETVEAFAG